MTNITSAEKIPFDITAHDKYIATMNLTFESLSSFLGSPVSSILFAALVLGYIGLSKSLKRLPRIPLALFVIYLLLKFAVQIGMQIDDEKSRIWLKVATSAALYCAVVRILFFATVEQWFLLKRKVPIPKITRDTILIFCYAVVVLVVMKVVGDVNPAGLITTSAVLTASIGFAAQNSLGNLFAGLSLQSDKPFSAGEWIKHGEMVGQVIQIGWKSTRIRTFKNEMVVIPNLDLTKTPIINFSRPSRAVVLTISVGVEYSTPPTKVTEVMLGICKGDPHVLESPPPEVRLKEFGDFAITYELRVSHNNFANQMKLKARLMNRIWYAFKREGIKIPFPIRDIQLSHIEEKKHLLQKQSEDGWKKSVIDAIPLLKPLSTEEKKVIAKHSMIQTYGAGEKIVIQGDEGDCAYVVYEGSCDVVLRHKEGSESVVNVLSPMSIFGEMSLLTGAARSATVVAKGDVSVIKIDKSAFSEILSSHGAVSETLAEMLAARAAELSASTDKSADLMEKKSQMLSRIKNFFGIG